MELRVLRYFLAVAREGTITRAAERLFVTQPTLSKQLKELEDELGCRLFERGTRTVTLTEEGRILRARAEEILGLAERARAELAAREALGGELSIAAGECPAMRLVARAAKTLRAGHPAIRLNLHSGNAEDVAERLANGLADFGMLIEPVELSRYAFLRLPWRGEWGLVLPKGHPLAAKAAVGPEDLRGLPLLTSRQGRVAEEFAGWLGRPLAALDVVGTYNLVYNAALMVEEGLGCALTLDRLIDDSPASPITFRPLTPALRVGAVLVWERNRLLSRAARAFLDVFRAQLAVADGAE